MHPAQLSLWQDGLAPTPPLSSTIVPPQSVSPQPPLVLVCSRVETLSLQAPFPERLFTKEAIGVKLQPLAPPGFSYSLHPTQL